jgi:hypothetical protein
MPPRCPRRCSARCGGRDCAGESPGGGCRRRCRESVPGGHHWVWQHGRAAGCSGWLVVALGWRRRRRRPSGAGCPEGALEVFRFSLVPTPWCAGRGSVRRGRHQGGGWAGRRLGWCGSGGGSAAGGRGVGGCAVWGGCLLFVAGACGPGGWPSPVSGVRLVSRPGAAYWSELYRGFDGEPTGEADLFRVETRTYGDQGWPRS